MMRAAHLSRRARRPFAFRPRLESLEQRQCLSVTVSTFALPGGNELRIVGNGDDDTINIADQGDGHFDVTDGDNNPLGSADDVIVVRIMSGGGNDTVNYTLGNPLTNRQAIYFNLGQGDDEAHFNLAAGISANLKIEGAGSAGNDTLDAILGPLTDALVYVDLYGGVGNDNISVEGVNGGPPPEVASLGNPHTVDAPALRVDLDGGWGDDNLSARLMLPADMALAVEMNGASGDDELSLAILPPGPDETPAFASEPGDGPGPAARPALHVDMYGGSGDDSIEARLGGRVAARAVVELDGGAGDDDVSLEVLGALPPPPPPSVAAVPGFNAGGLYADLDGGPGDDTVSATLGVLPVGRTRVEMNGGSGDDELTFDATDVAIAAGSALSAKLNGGSGDDTVTGTYSGQILGVLKYQAYGGPGDDTLVSNLTATAGSTGSLYALSAGNSGDDDVTLNVYDESGDGGDSTLAALHAAIFDLGGHDTLTHTDNVRVITNMGHALRLGWLYGGLDDFNRFDLL